MGESAPAPVLPDFGGKRSGPRLELYSTLNKRPPLAMEGKVCGRLSWQSAGDTVLVSGERTWIRVLRGAVHCSPAIGSSGLLGGLLDRDQPLRGALLGSAAVALGCVF